MAVNIEIRFETELDRSDESDDTFIVQERELLTGACISRGVKIAGIA